MRSVFRILPPAVMLCAALSISVAISAAEDQREANPPAKESPRAAPLELDDPLLPFVPRTPTSETEKNRLEALALFSAARAHEQRDQFDQALRLYERALRFDPDSLPILRQIVPLAFSLGRNDEALRYALLAAELDPSDALALRQLGVHLTGTGDFARAAALYEKALAANGADQRNAGAVILSVELARLYFLLGKFPQAADAAARVTLALEHPDDYGLSDAVQKAILDEPDETYRFFAAVLLEAERFDEALAAFEKADQLKPRPARLGYDRARVAAARQQSAQALEHLQAYFDARQASEGLAPYALLAELLEQLDTADELVPRLEALHQNDPANEPLRRSLADAYRGRDDFARAEPLYRELLAEEPSADVLRGLAEIYRQTEQFEALLDILSRAAAAEQSLDLLGEEIAEIVADAAVLDALTAAARQLQTARPPVLPEGGSIAMAVLSLEAGRWDAAGEFFELAITAAGDDQAEILLRWGLGLLIQEEYARAVDVFQRGIDERALPADNPAFAFYLSGALEMVGRTEEALSVARDAAQRGDGSPRLEERVAWILYHAERYDEARDAYAEFIDRHDDEHGSTDVRDILRQARLVLSNIFATQHDYAQAEERLEQVLDEFPDDISALNDLGYLWADQGKHLERALEMVQKAVAGEPDNAAYQDSLGWVLYRLGRFEEARLALEKAAHGDEPDGVILDHLGDVYHALGEHDLAADAWRRAVDILETAGDEENLPRVREKLAELGAAAPASLIK